MYVLVNLHGTEKFSWLTKSGL